MFGACESMLMILLHLVIWFGNGIGKVAGIGDNLGIWCGTEIGLAGVGAAVDIGTPKMCL